MIPGGYILQPRKIDESDVSKMPPVTRELWLYLLRKVNYKDNGVYKRGQGFFCFNEIQNDLCWYAGYRKIMYSKPQLTKSLRRLCEGNMVETTKATRGIVVTICKYDYYQTKENYEGNDEKTAKEPRKKSSGHTKNKKDKEEIIEEEIKLIINENGLGFAKVVETWLEYKKERNEGYQKTGFTAFVNMLKKLSGNDARKALEIINQSMSSGWKGVFPLKADQTKSFSTQKSKFETATDVLKQYIEDDGAANYSG